jgi:pimeloyl-ACP methyl ester carboxylesterase
VVRADKCALLMHEPCQSPDLSGQGVAKWHHAGQHFRQAAADMRTTGSVDPEPALQRWFSPAALAEPHGFVEQVRSWLEEAQVSSWAAALDLIAGFDVLDDLPQVSVPVDVVCAELDQIATPGHMTEICAALPLGRWVLLQSARHLVPIEHPAAVAAAIFAD